VLILGPKCEKTPKSGLFKNEGIPEDRDTNYIISNKLTVRDAVAPLRTGGVAPDDLLVRRSQLTQRYRALSLQSACAAIVCDDALSSAA
jgi:hypothetical protein